MSFFGVAQTKGLTVINIDKSLCHYLTAGGSRKSCFRATKHELSTQSPEPTGDSFLQIATEPPQISLSTCSCCDIVSQHEHTDQLDSFFNVILHKRPSPLTDSRLVMKTSTPDPNLTPFTLRSCDSSTHSLSPCASHIITIRFMHGDSLAWMASTF